MPPNAPQEFELQVFDKFNTHDANAPIVGTDIVGTLPITLHWNAGRTDLTKKGVEFGDATWQSPGCGPLQVYEETIGGNQLVGDVSWSLKTRVLKKKEMDSAPRRYRWLITPVVELWRKQVRPGAKSGTTQLVYTASNSVLSAWTKA